MCYNNVERHFRFRIVMRFFDSFYKVTKIERAKQSGNKNTNNCFQAKLKKHKRVIPAEFMGDHKHWWSCEICE